MRQASSLSVLHDRLDAYPTPFVRTIGKLSRNGKVSLIVTNPTTDKESMLIVGLTFIGAAREQFHSAECWSHCGG